MHICDGKGNLSTDFLDRLEELKREQGENMRELERLKIDAFIEGRNPRNQEANHVTPLQLDKTITEMWMDFNLAERLNHLPDLPKEIHQETDRKAAAAATKEKWSPKVTVPEPFSMTLREELDPHPPRQSRASLEVEAARLKREQIENQISKNFKSRPVPAETYYPLYHDILLQSESRRQLVLENRRRELERIQNPPSFIEREERKKRENAERKRKAKDEEERLINLLSNSFRAQEIDEKVFEEKVDLDAEEEARQARIRSRSEHLLRSASLPSRMKSAPVRKATQSEPFLVERKRSHIVPDFKKLHKENSKRMEMAKKKAEQERNNRPKTAAPILQTSKRSQSATRASKAVTFEDTEREFRATKIAFTPESPPIKANDSFSKRKDFVRQTLDLLESQLLSEKEKIKERKRRERIRGKSVRKNLPPKANSVNQVEKLRELQQEDRRRIQEYREMLAGIYNKVDERPLLCAQR